MSRPPRRLLGVRVVGVLARVKDRSAVELVDLPRFERSTRLVWHKPRWQCPDADGSMGSWTEQDGRIAGSRQVLTSRAVRWATIEVGRQARSVNEVAGELGCEWHTVEDTVLAYGEARFEVDAAFGFTSFRNHRIRSLLHAGKPNRNQLATATPR